MDTPCTLSRRGASVYTGLPETRPGRVVRGGTLPVARGRSVRRAGAELPILRSCAKLMLHRITQAGVSCFWYAPRRPRHGNRLHLQAEYPTRKASAMAVHRIAVIGGDGIGPEVIDQAIRAAEAAAKKHDGAALAWTRLPWSTAYYKQHGRMLPEDGWDQLQRLRRNSVRRGRRSLRAGQDHGARTLAAHAAASSTST